MFQTKNWKTENFPAEVFKLTYRHADGEDGFELYALKVDCFVNTKFDHSDLIFLEPVNQIAELGLLVPNALLTKEKGT